MIDKAKHFYHRIVRQAIDLVYRSIKDGGPIQQYRTELGHRAMQRAAHKLPQSTPHLTRSEAEVAFVTGPRFWHQTVFCFTSLQLVTQFRITPVIYGDAEMDHETKSLITMLIPWAHFVGHEEIEKRLDAVLPERLYPHLRQRRRVYPHLRKFVDTHIGQAGFTLVLDSDMLFFRRAIELEAWFEKKTALYMQDIATNYGYSTSFLSELVGLKLPERVNVGLYALDSSRLDWDQIEYWCRRQDQEYIPSYYQEQAITAMALAGTDAVALPRHTYLVLPSVREGRSPTAVLHHYVAHSKRSYFQYGWRIIAERAQCRARETS